MAFVANEGALVKLDRADQPRGYSIQITDDYFATYDAIYQYQPEVRTVIGFLARNVAQLNIHVYRRRGDDDRERLTDHPMARFFAAPNPWTTLYTMLSQIVSDLGIYDFYIAAKLGTSQQPATVRIPPSRVKPVGDNWLYAEKWEIDGSKGKLQLDRDRLIIIHGYNPTDSRIGLSPIEALRSILAEEYEATKNRQRAWRNGSRYTGIIERPPGAPAWSRDAKKRFKADWAAGPDGPAGGTPVLEDGMKFVPQGMTPEQMEYIQGRRLTREECAAAYYIPPPMVGILDNANYSNVESYHRSVYQDTLGPILTQIQQELTRQLLPEVADSQDVYIEFNLREKLEGSFAEQASQMQSAIGAPWLTRNEGRARMNLPAVAGGDELVVPLNVLVGGQASPNDSAPDNPSTDGNPKASELVALQAGLSEVITTFLRRQGKSVQAALGANATGWWNKDRWDRELAADLRAAGLTPDIAAAVAAAANERTYAAVAAALKMADPRAEVAAVFAAGTPPLVLEGAP